MSSDQAAVLWQHRRDWLHSLLREKGVYHYGLFFVTGEGITMPNGLEESSGYVVANDGRTFRYWFGWDTIRHSSAFTTWRRIEPRPQWTDEEEYQHALRDAGIQS
jgi:hypothetical protein